MTYNDETLEGVRTAPLPELLKVAPDLLVEKIYDLLLKNQSYMAYAVGCIIADTLPKDIVTTGGDIVKVTWNEIEGSGETRSEAFLDFAIKFFTHENGTKQVQSEGADGEGVAL